MTSDHPERGRPVKGVWVLLALFGGALLLVPLATWATLRWVESGLIETPRLNWNDRERWRNTPVRWTTVERQGLAVSANRGPWRELDFNLSSHEEAVLRQCIVLARMAEDDLEAFTQPGMGSMLQQLARQAPQSFYPSYLLGTWHRLRGESEPANAAYRASFERAHGVVKQRYVTTDNQPLAGQVVGTFELSHARSDGQRLDDTLVLVYPALETDRRGFVYLPVYDTLYRISRPPQPTDYHVRYDAETWFDFPDRVGTLRPAVVRPSGQ
ncbi:hypothetical protein ACERK3_01185 [Phycisphaerales bacterium AB-hyl4]|uniref:Uncharacterized protein n=1 Tax=Natronomicrosphaera hydrolytica TaxID=3242702 RepID=A0ABV4TZX0_9BACT